MMIYLDLKEIVMLCLIFIGMVLMLIAAIGIVRMPDLYLRNSVSSKGATLGVTALMLATVLYFDELGTSSRAFAVILFMLLTAPIAAHMLGRAAYRSHVPFWSKTYIDKEISHLHMESDRASR